MDKYFRNKIEKYQPIDLIDLAKEIVVDNIRAGKLDMIFWAMQQLILEEIGEEPNIQCKLEGSKEKGYKSMVRIIKDEDSDNR